MRPSTYGQSNKTCSQCIHCIKHEKVNYCIYGDIVKLESIRGRTVRDAWIKGLGWISQVADQYLVNFIVKPNGTCKSFEELE